MGLFDLLWGPPTEEKFARQLMDAMRRAGMRDALTWDAENRRIIIGEQAANRHAFVGNFHKEHLALPRTSRAAHLERTARVVMGVEREMAETWEEARPHIRPKLWARVAISHIRLQMLLDGGDPEKFDLPDYEVGSHFIASLVYDFPDQMASINRSQLEKWGVSYYEALEAARENLEGEPVRCAQIGDGLYSVMTGDSYDACRLLLPDLIDRLEVRGDVIAMVPNRDSLLVTGSEDEEGLRMMLDLTDQALEQPRPLVPIPLCLVDGEWQDWQPSVDHPLWSRFQELRVRFLADEYGEQRRLLELCFQRQMEDVFVASFALLRRGEGPIFSYCIWPAGIRALIPVTDWIAFARASDAPPVMARGDDVLRLAGHLLQLTEHYPPRYEVRGFPTDDELRQLESELPE